MLIDLFLPANVFKFSYLIYLSGIFVFFPERHCFSLLIWSYLGFFKKIYRYGYVTPEDVPVLLEQHVVKGEIVDWLWR